MELYLKDIHEVFNIEKDEISKNVVKAIVWAMKQKGFCVEEKQKLVLDSDMFEYCWTMYKTLLEHFDPNYNRRHDFLSLFNYIISSTVDDEKIEFNSLFCPGYTRHGYKNKLGHTTTWKLEELSKIRDMFDEHNIKTVFKNYYSDVFLENFDSSLEPNWKEQMEYNRYLFHEEGKKYFNSDEVLNASSIPIFSEDKDIYGYVDPEIIKSIKIATYSAFIKSNQKFYESLDFTKEQMQERNDRLITMYRKLSDYLNQKNNIVFLPMENMYERENIFSENGTCTMYLKLKR